MRFDLTINEFTIEMMTKRRLTAFGGAVLAAECTCARCRKAIQMVFEQPFAQMPNAVFFNLGATDQE